jgi:SAM-dependent methyltransferase
LRITGLRIGHSGRVDGTDGPDAGRADPVSGVPRPPGNAWFDELARFLGTAYLRNAFTYGTEQEVDFLWDRLHLHAGARVLDLGCGPGRHSLALARRGASVVGVDHSEEFVALARAGAEREGLGAEFRAADVRELDEHDEFDAVICLCQGGFGLLGGQEDAALIGRFAAALKPGGCMALTAFHVAFAVRFLEPGDHFDPVTGVHYERATLRDPAGVEREFDLWTTCFTPRELRMMATDAGLAALHVYGVTPGKYDAAPPRTEDPELLLLAVRPGGK